MSRLPFAQMELGRVDNLCHHVKSKAREGDDLRNVVEAIEVLSKVMKDVVNEIEQIPRFE